MPQDLGKRFTSNLLEIDSIFNTSSALKEIYLANLDSLSKQQMPNTVQMALQNKIAAMKNVGSSSINNAEKKNWDRLYAQGLILVVSISEQMLKEAFELLLFSNLDKVKKLDKESFSFLEIQQKRFSLTMSDWIELLKERLYNEKNPSEKINFQNIKSIEGLFLGYFEIRLDLPEELSKQLHLYYQMRHIAAETINEAIMIAELGTTYKRTGFHFDKRLEKMTDTIKYFKKNEKLSFVQDKNALTHKLIIGDNYDALLNLLIEYRNKIDVIYIDPPYGKDSMGEFAEMNYENAITRDNLLSR